MQAEGGSGGGRIRETAPRDVDGPAFGPGGVDRRSFLRGLAALGAGGALASVLGDEAAAHRSRRRRRRRPGFATAFPDGVMSGDPRPYGGVLRTRVEAPEDGAPVPVLWLVCEDSGLRRVVRGGVTWAREAHGHSVKVAVRGLRPDRWYHYRFYAPGARSHVGRLRTAPRRGATPDRLRYAFASCQQRNDSFYVAHRSIAEEDVDFWMHLGDYIYVSDTGDLTLEDYRRRWRIFQSEPNLQALQARVPIVSMFDDGEFYNGVDSTGPPDRLAAARTAWFEAMPILRRRDDRAYRSFRWGRLAEVLMIDVRTHRDPEVPANANIFGALDLQDSRIPPGPDMFAPDRTTLGARQQRWLERRLARSRGRWRLIGNPYNMNPWRIQDLDSPERRAMNPDLQRNEGVYVSNEAWDDYQAERREVLEFIERRSIENVVFTSGHTHFYLASELQPDFDDPDSPSVAVDFVTGSLTADPDPREIADEGTLKLAEQLFLVNNMPYLRYVDLLSQGYALVEVTPEEATVEYRVLDTFDPEARARTAARFRVASGSGKIEIDFDERV